MRDQDPPPPPRRLVPADWLTIELARLERTYSRADLLVGDGRHHAAGLLSAAEIRMPAGSVLIDCGDGLVAIAAEHAATRIGRLA